ncbi:hypothetical protein [Candidatus Oleimmundimicrobium sp.]|nr:hypothetical protein [Candidatus Oleimmundimicrobium sp.]MDO8886110.1 hypothetical protein [Candidatus Oleimmundimicrobium sp.]
MAVAYLPVGTARAYSVDSLIAKLYFLHFLARPRKRSKRRTADHFLTAPK